MHGVALLVAAASLGVDYSWRTTDEGQLEYVIQIEPEFLKSLAEGEEIHSDVPAEAGQIQRICVRIGTKAVTHTASGKAQYKRLLVSAGRYATTDVAVPAADAIPTIFWPARTNPEQSFAVTYGWQPDQAGQLAYYVQLDPSLLQTLVAGDEVHAAVDPSAGQVGQFVILSGSKQLPRVGTQPELAALQPPPTTAGGKTNRFQPGLDQNAFGQPAGVAPATNDSTLYPRQPPKFGAGTSTAGTNDLRSPAFDTSPAGSYQPAGPVLNSPAGSYQPSTTTPGNYYSNEPLAPTSPAYGDTQYGDNRLDDRYADSRFGDPRGTLQPPASSYGNQQGYVQQTGAEQLQQQVPPRTGGFTASSNYVPQTPLDNRLASVNPNSTAANTPLPAPQISNNSVTSKGSASTSERWMPLMFTAFALFLSIGGNLYLGWTAAEFYQRYRLATERLRSAGRA